MPARTRWGIDLHAIRIDVAARAASQGHVFRRTDLERWGFDATICRTMLRRRLWMRLRHGVYVDAARFNAVAADPCSRHLLDLASAHAMLDGQAFAFGLSAAHLHGLPLPREHDHTVHLLRSLDIDHRALRPGRHTSRETGDVHVTGHELTGIATTMVEHFPVVDRTLAALSTAAAVSPDWAVAVLDAGCWQDAAALETLHAMVDDWPALLGIGTVRRALPWVRTGAQSPLESISRIRLLRLGLPEPELQVAFHDAEGLVGYADMWWPDLGVIGEADGALKYDGVGKLVAEKWREDRLRALGVAVVRWSWSDMMSRPQVVAAQIRRAAGWTRPRPPMRPGRPPQPGPHPRTLTQPPG